MEGFKESKPMIVPLPSPILWLSSFSEFSGTNSLSWAPIARKQVDAKWCKSHVLEIFLSCVCFFWRFPFWMDVLLWMMRNHIHSMILICGLAISWATKFIKFTQLPTAPCCHQKVNRTVSRYFLRIHTKSLPGAFPVCTTDLKLSNSTRLHWDLNSNWDFQFQEVLFQQKKRWHLVTFDDLSRLAFRPQCLA